MHPLRILSFFLVVPLVPMAMLLALAALAIGGCVAIAVAPDAAGRALAPVLLVQLFATASGFRVPARRGHYDLLFTGGAQRPTIAAAHWLMSTAPGLLAWLVLAVAEWAAGAAALHASGTVLAIVLVSTLPWALTAAWSRLSGAILLLLLSITIAAAAPMAALTIEALWPWVLIGVPIEPVRLVALWSLALTSVAAAVVWISRTDVPLESSQ